MLLLIGFVPLAAQAPPIDECGGVLNALPSPASTCSAPTINYWLENHVTKEIAMRFVIIRKSDGSGNFQENDLIHQAYLNGLESGINSYYENFSNNTQASCSPVSCNLYSGGNSFIKFKLAGITYIDDDAVYNLFATPPALTPGSVFSSVFTNHGVNRQKEVNVFFVEALYNATAGAIATMPGLGSSNGNGTLPYTYMFRNWAKIELEFKPNNHPIEWMYNAWTLPHELGHCLGLADINATDGTPPHECCHRFMITQNVGYHNTVVENELAICHRSLTEKTISNYVCNCPYAQDNPIDVSGTETWNCYMRVYSDIRVLPNASLTLTNLLLMPKNARIIVYPGAKLIVNGGKISSGCDNEYWQGIQVLGNSDEPHPPLPFNPLTHFAPAHGIAYLYNNATIENAKVGVATAMLNAEGAVIANPGGMVWAHNNTLFKNNQVGVFIANPHNALLRISQVQNCRFEINDSYQGGAGLYGQPVGIASRSGQLVIPIKNNIFVNLQATPETKQRGIGIFNSSTGMQIGEPEAENRFENLYKGIDYYAGPSITSVVNIRHNNFIANNKAITLNGGIFARVENNDINVTHFGNNSMAGYGIYTARASGFRIENNIFTCADAAPNLNLALELRRDLNYAAGAVTNNSFEGTFAVANVFSGKNPNLNIDCNRYYHPINIDWLLFPLLPDDYLNDQGECDPFAPQFARRNSFKPSPNGIQYLNIYNATNATLQYRAQSAAFVPEINVEMQGEVDVFECFENQQLSHCASDNPCNPECLRQQLSQTAPCKSRCAFTPHSYKKTCDCNRQPKLK